MSYDFIVIGAGISGASSAIALAQNGFRVALLEKERRIMPLLSGFSRQGVQFDTGFHYAGGLGDGGALELYLRYLGLSERIESFPFDREGFDIFSCPAERFEFRFPAGEEALREALGSAFPGERAAVASYLNQVRSVCASLPYQNLDAPEQSLGLPQISFGPTLKETLDLLTGDRLLKSLLSVHTLLYGVPSHQVSFAQHAVIVGNYYQSAAGIRGGGLSLARAFEARLAELGVDTFCGSEATGIETDSGGAFSGVRLAGGDRLPGRGCVATLHPRLLLELVPEGSFRPSYRRRLASLEDTASAYLAYAVCGAPIPSLAGANLFLVPDPESVHELGRRPVGATPLYISGAYRPGEEVPTGFVGIFPAGFTESAPFQGSLPRARGPGYRDFKREALQRMRGQIERLAPELSGGILSLEGSTPLTVRDFCCSPSGGLYGVKHMVGQHNPLPATRMKGLYLAGQALVSPGLMGGVLSGLLACGSVIGHQQMREELKRCS